MEEFIEGDIIVLKFPFSDLTNYKKRPALIIKNINGNDSIVLQITSIARRDEYSVKLCREDFSEGSLPINSLIRINKIFTADKSLFLYKAGTIGPIKFFESKNKLIKLFS